MPIPSPSYPMIDTSRSGPKPQSRKARIAPMATWSEIQHTAVVGAFSAVDTALSENFNCSAMLFRFIIPP